MIRNQNRESAPRGSAGGRRAGSAGGPPARLPKATEKRVESANYRMQRCVGARVIFIALLVFVCVLTFHTTAEAQLGPYAESRGIPAWAATRAKQARTGRREIVQIPLVRRSDGWGCICPEYYIGLSTANAASSTWIEPRFARNNLRLSKNTLVVAEGYFTGRRIRQDLRDNPDAPKEWIYRLWEFRVTRIRRLPEDHQVYDEENSLNRVAIKKRSSNRRT